MNRYDQLMNNPVFSKLCILQFLVAIIIYITLLLIPEPQLGGDPQKSFLLHGLGNFLLILSTWLASGGRLKTIGPVLFVIPFSMLVELSQGLTDNRTPELIDIAANLCGIFAGMIACTIICNPVVEKLKRIRLKD